MSDSSSTGSGSDVIIDFCSSVEFISALRSLARTERVRLTDEIIPMMSRLAATIMRQLLYDGATSTSVSSSDGTEAAIMQAFFKQLSEIIAETGSMNSLHYEVSNSVHEYLSSRDDSSFAELALLSCPLQATPLVQYRACMLVVCGVLRRVFESGLSESHAEYQRDLSRYEDVERRDNHGGILIDRRDVQAAVALDQQLAGMMCELGIDQAWILQPEEHYERIQDKIKSLYQQHAWFHNPASISLVLDRLQRGTLPRPPTSATSSLSSTLSRFSIRPVAWLGQRWFPAFATHINGSANSAVYGIPRRSDGDGGDEEGEGEGQDTNEGPYPSSACAFDIVDAHGRVFPMLLERFCATEEQRNNFPLQVTHLGQLFDRRTRLELAKIGRDGVMSIGGSKGNTVVAKYFEQYTPAIEDASMEEELTRAVEQFDLRPDTSDANANPSIVHFLSLACLGGRLASAAAGGFDAVPLGAWTLYHPLDVRVRFTVAALREAFDSKQVGRRDNMPDVCVDLIAQYAIIDALPELPLRVEDFTHEAAVAPQPSSSRASTTAASDPDASTPSSCCFSFRSKAASTSARVVAPAAPAASSSPPVATSSSSPAAAAVERETYLDAKTGKPFCFDGIV